MDEKNNKFLFDILIVLAFVVAIFSLFFSLIKENDMANRTWIFVVCIMCLLEIVIAFWIREKRRNNYEGNKINELIRYSQKRKEIEQEISRLTYELVNSDVGQYIDINQLVFSGQNDNGLANYNAFLEQFGIDKEKIRVQENSAVFIAPFNEEDKLYEECQIILSRINIFLKRTDNTVDKDDILMNVVTMIVKSELVLVNIDGRNPNVYYELGIAHALGKQTILLSKTDFNMKDFGFDIRQKRIIFYKSKEDLEKQLLYQVNRLKGRE